jgi:hypothetical protein
VRSPRTAAFRLNSGRSSSHRARSASKSLPPQRPSVEGRKTEDERPVGTADESATLGVPSLPAKYRSRREAARASQVIDV